MALTGRAPKPEYAAAPAYVDPDPLWSRPEGADDLDAKLDADIEAATQGRAKSDDEKA